MSKYTGNEIKVLKGLEAVRKRPGMYIGGTNRTGLHHLIWEIVDNSIDEHMNGYGNNITLTVKQNGYISIEDNGRGIPVDIHPTEKIPTLTVALTVLHAGGKFDNNNYKVSGGLHGVGVSVVNALSEKLIATVYRNNTIYQEVYSKGEVISPLTTIGKTKRTGTTIEFYPDFSIMESNPWDDLIISKRLKELAYLNSKLTINYINEQLNKQETYHYDGGIIEYINSTSTKDDYWLTDPIRVDDKITVDDKVGTVRVEIALRYNTGYSRNLKSYVNNINTEAGGTHEEGFRRGLNIAIKNYKDMYVSDIKIKEMQLTPDDLLEGVTGIVSIYMCNPEFEGQTKSKLGSPAIVNVVRAIVQDKFFKYLEHNPDDAKAIIKKISTSYLAREAARRARELTRTQQVLVSNTSLPTKLADCSSKNPLERELFIVEGDSAGGSAKQGRDRAFQAILPIRGKILNVEKASMDKIMSSEEVKNIVTSLGCGIGDKFNLDKLRYHKVIIMTDSDVDGSHIQTLLLTFFYRYMPELIINHKVYIAQPPLYRLSYGNRQHIYYQTDKELNDFITIEGAKKIANNYSDDAYNFSYLIGILRQIDDGINELVREYNNRDLITEMVFTNMRGLGLNKLLEELSNAMTSKRINLDLLSYTEANDSLTMYTRTPIGLEKITIDDEFINHPILIHLSQLVSSLKGVTNITNIDPTRYPTYLLDECRKAFGNYTLQRYKGLGEMNPDQLWETTMSPDTRTLLSVHIDDDVVASETFKLLMGDDAAPRKRFISEHARNVRVLDI